MPTKLPTQSVNPPTVSMLSNPLDAKRRHARRQCVFPASLRACLGGTLFTLVLSVSGAALAHSDTELTNSSHKMIRGPQLLAQQVIDGLPPPPPIPNLQVPDETDLPQGSGPQEEAGNIYMVYINGDSPLLLEQVQQVEPTARIQSLEGQQVILAGLFDRSSSANEQIERLEQRGIDANVVSVSSVVLSPSAPPTRSTSGTSTQPPRASLDDLPPADPVSTVTRSTSRPRPSVSVAPPSVSSPGPSTTVTNAPRRDNAYYVVIPGDEDELGAMWEQVVLLGAAPNAVEQRDRPLGPHLLVGPFMDQDAATRWNRFFQDFGMDARVYYKR